MILLIKHFDILGSIIRQDVLALCSPFEMKIDSKYRTFYDLHQSLEVEKKCCTKKKPSLSNLA